MQLLTSKYSLVLWETPSVRKGDSRSDDELDRRPQRERSKEN